MSALSSRVLAGKRNEITVKHHQLTQLSAGFQIKQKMLSFVPFMNMKETFFLLITFIIK
jgi:hypothetical protein